MYIFILFSFYLKRNKRNVVVNHLKAENKIRKIIYLASYFMLFRKPISFLLNNKAKKSSTLLFRCFISQQSTRTTSKMQHDELSIPLWQYNTEKYGWAQKQYDSGDPKYDWDRFRVVTYNIWFDNIYQPIRFNSLCDILNKSNAQIIGLQESSCFF